jgi:hypothetical protein
MLRRFIRYGITAKRVVKAGRMGSVVKLLW